MNKRILAVVLSVILAISLAACSTQKSDSTDKTLQAKKPEAEQSTTQKMNDSADFASTKKSLVDTESIFTDRDFRTEIDKTQAVKITLKNNASSSDSELVKIKDNKITITDEGVYIFSGSLDDGQIIVDAENTDKIQLVLNGVTISSKSSAAIYVKQAKKVFVNPKEDTKNVLSTTGSFKPDGKTNVDAVIFSKDDITLCGLGSLEIRSTAHGVVSKDDLKITHGSYVIEAEKHCINGENLVATAEGSLDLMSGKDGIHCSYDDDLTKGFVYIKSGKISAKCDGDGIDASGNVQIDGGSLHIKESEEGIEGCSIQINSGTVDITSSDDGMNATSGKTKSDNPMAVDSKASIIINGGKLTIDAAGDGVDSNGGFFVNGGESYVSGAVNDGDSPVDFASQAVVTGGILIATGMSGMAQGFSQASAQGSMLLTLGKTTDSGFSLKEGSKELISFTPAKKYNCVVLTTPDIVKGGKYTFVAGDEVQEIEMTDIIYGKSGMGMFGGGMKPPEDFGDVPTGNHHFEDDHNGDFHNSNKHHYNDNGVEHPPEPPQGEMPQGTPPQPPDMNNNNKQ